MASPSRSKKVPQWVWSVSRLRQIHRWPYHPPPAGENFGRNPLQWYRYRHPVQKTAACNPPQTPDHLPGPIFQPVSRMPVGEIIGEAVREHGIVPKEEYNDYIDKIMSECGLQSFHKDRYPHEFSGGQRQRICIARALALTRRLSSATNRFRHWTFRFRRRLSTCCATAAGTQPDLSVHLA